MSRALDSIKEKCYQKGYKQAEKNIISLIESRIGEILGDAQPVPVLRAELRELIKRIKGETEMRCENCKDTLCPFRLTAGECRNFPNCMESFQHLISTDNEAVETTNAIVHLTTRGWTCIAPGGIDIKELQEAAKALVEAVEGYVCPKKGDKYVFRNEVLAKCNELKQILNEAK